MEELIKEHFGTLVNTLLGAALIALFTFVVTINSSDAVQADAIKELRSGIKDLQMQINAKTEDRFDEDDGHALNARIDRLWEKIFDLHRSREDGQAE